MAAPRSFLSYDQAGVSIRRGDRLVEHIKKYNSGIGGFGGLFPLPARGYKKPVLVASTDGVGTKLLVANTVGRHDTIGIDLVAMVVNDLIVCGARPLFFLDYFATGHLQLNRAREVLKGIAAGCAEADCPILGGETAEMPGMYSDGHYDLAGFGVGVVDQSRVLRPESVRPGDRLIGLASSGLHSNGYSLARKIVFGKAGLKPKDKVKELGLSVGEALLEPTRIYVRPILRLLRRFHIRSIAHITGGGITGNLNRALNPKCDALVKLGSWERKPIFDWLKRLGPVRDDEMGRTFNMGLGMIVVAPKDEAAGILRALKRMGETAWEVGEVVKGQGKVQLQ